MGKPGFPMPLLQQPIFTLAVHVAPPHNAAMNIAWERGRPALVASLRAR